MEDLKWWTQDISGIGRAWSWPRWFLSLCYAVVSGSDGVLPCSPQACSVLFGFIFPQLAPSLPQCQFQSFLIFIKFAMTFHLGGLDVKALHFWRWGRIWLFHWGRLVQRGQSKCNTEPSLPNTPQCTTVSRPPAGLPMPSRGCCHHWEASRTLFPHLGDSELLEDWLGQKTGCNSQCTGWVCQIPNYQARISANKSTQLPFIWCLEQGISCNYCLTILPLDPPFQTREASLPRNHTSLQGPARLCPSLALRTTTPTEI